MAASLAVQTPAPDGSEGVRTLAAGPMRAKVRAADGGRVAALWREEPKGGRTDVLVPMRDDQAFVPEQWPKAGCYPLAPWSNRIRGARFPFEGEDVVLPPQSADIPHTMHGFSHQRPWTVVEHGPATLTMRYRHVPDAWKWAFEAEQHLALDGAGLTIEMRVRNLSDRAMPVGFGVHPFLAVAHGDTVRFSAQGQWQADETGCAVERRALDPAQGRHVAPHGPRAVTDYFDGFGGVASVARRDGSTVVIETGAPLGHFIFHAPEGGAYVCLEPVSHVADAFNLAARGVEGSGARVLKPQESIGAVVRIGLA
ncbi:aldose 1-epimerase [Alsobacter sp. SYSU M60028]|uniref:Aldose 1-epimerase n=1 Tax=Alsobacter ponti TaxID=2962936 RepID=A0ABT1LGD2_9HYPH|nr:aldose 1-epimerase [Alsobacter ponti]MCP8940560.1 aldose 1-epimerase [Alsobacter ponti]